MMKVNETHVHAIYVNTKGTTLFQVCCRLVLIFPINFNFTHTRQPTSQLGMNFIHVINFSNLQVLRITVVYGISKVRFFL